MSTNTVRVKIPVVNSVKYQLVEEFCCGSIQSAIEKQKQQKHLHLLEDYKILRSGGWVFVFRHPLSIQLEEINNKFNS